MSRTALVVVVIVALALGAIFLILRASPRGGGGGPPEQSVASPIAGMDQQRIAEVRIRPPEALGQRPATLVRSAPDTWMLEAASIRWPANPGPILELLRTLDSGATPRAGAAAPPPPPSAATIEPLVLEIIGPADAVTINLATTPLAGAIAMESSNGFVGTAPASLLDLLTKPGPSSWRLTTPFPGLDTGAATSLTIGSRDGTVELARLEKRWRVIRPVAARANPAVVEDALARAGAYTIARFFDESKAGASEAGLENPALELSIARDLPPGAGGAARGRTDRRTLAIGDALPSGASWHATIDEPAPVVVELTGPPPTSFSTAVRSYLATTATDVAPADVGAVRLAWKDGRERLLERALDEWVERPGDAPGEAAPIEEALAFLHDEPGEPQESFAESDVRPLLRVELLDFAGAPLEILSVGYNADGELGVRGANVIWLYGRYRGPALFGLPSFADLPAEAETPPAPEREGGYPAK